MSSASKNVSSPYRISLKNQWKVDANTAAEVPNKLVVRSTRSFHRPSGLAINQVLLFCFEPVPTDILFFINGLQQPLIANKGLATVKITSMMESINRVELRWLIDPSERPQLPEHFAAWLEILED